MARHSKTYRVSILGNLRNEVTYPLVQSVLRYGEQAESWRFVGSGSLPFIAIERLGEMKVDGLIGLFDNRESAERAAACARAVVNIVHDITEVTLPRVTNDDTLIGRIGAEHLLERGFAHFGFVDDAESLVSQRRCEGFVETVEAAGRACHVFSRSWFEQRDPEKMISKWLSDLPKPIGVMAHIDYFAHQVIEAALHLDLRVPDDVAVVGVNNNPWMTALSPVPLSSIELDMRQIGYRAAKLLDGLMAGEAPPPTQLIPPIGVVTRRSTEVTLADDPIVSHAMRYIRDHVTEGVNVEDVLSELGVSRSTLVNRMKHATGRTPHQAIIRARIDHAKNLLLNSDESMDEIARRCGFLRQPRLNETFKRVTGLTPGQFRQQRHRR